MLWVGFDADDLVDWGTVWRRPDLNYPEALKPLSIKVACKPTRIQHAYNQSES